MTEIKNLSSNQRFFLNILVPSLYTLPLILAYLGPKNFGFGYEKLVYLGLFLAAAGLAIWILAMLTLGSSLAVLPGTSRLVTRGVYRYFRHPIYIGIVLTLTGLFLACGSLVCLVYVITIVVPLNIFRARSEEKFLREQLGDVYQKYHAITYF